VQGHEPQFIQLLQNLISNGLKYHAPDRPPKIHVSARKDGDVWCVSVKDNGVGIATEYHKQIFRMFKRLHDRDTPGTGIGLAICERVVERYGGRIWVDSTVNEGATFYFTIPIVAKRAAANVV
jgi:signal transduction histidine kinase